MRFFLTLSLLTLISSLLSAQDKPISPSIIGKGVFYGISQPLRDLPALSDEEIRNLRKPDEKEFNEGLQFREYPFSSIALPKGPDAVWQKDMGASGAPHAPIVNFEAQGSSYYPPDCNGTVGPNHFMQTVNCTYAIYDKTGTKLAGPTNMNQLFSGVPGANCNDGDPLVLYDDEADRWLAVEFSLCGSNDMMLVAVSTTNDPTGTWYKYSFDVADTPDYEKFGIWQDGYYMGSNNGSGNDIYVFERSQMLTGGTNPQMVGFNNAWRPSSIDGFMCVPPVDNDGAYAPAGSPGLFIAFNDDAIGGGSDELWIYELAVNWTSPSSSTFNRVQQLPVAPFDCNFGNNWDNIKQPGTNQELDAIPQVIMNVPQYRNFGSYQTIVCCHTVDVDNTDHAGIRWYELRKTGTNWTVRQQGTYAPDAQSRWMGSIMLNNSNELGLGYSVSSTSVYPSIRYCGQTAPEYQNATGIMDFPEGEIQAGSASQTGANRWGDYALMSVDPVDDESFWFTTEYIGNGGSHKTRVASFQVGIVAPVSNFVASNTFPCLNDLVTFTDLSSGSPFAWQWTISPATYTWVDGTDSTSENPHVRFMAYGNYTITLTVTNGGGSQSLTKAAYISVNAVNDDFTANATTVVVGSSTVFTDASSCSVSSWSWDFGEGASPATATTQGPHVVTFSTTGLKTVTLTVNDTVVQTKTDYINVIDPGFNMGNATVSACSGNFYDSGGSASNYGNNQDYTLVLYPGVPGNKVRVIFNSFFLEAGLFCANDNLRVYDGTSNSSTVIGIYCGSNIKDTITATNADGALTFVFHSNSQISFPGWSAVIECVEGVANPLVFNAVAAGSTQVDLSWIPNTNVNDVMVAWSPDGVFGSPEEGTSYQPGDTLTGGGTILYYGNATSYSHAQLNPLTTYCYKAFSSTQALNWSAGIQASVTTLATPTLSVDPLTMTVAYESDTAAFQIFSNAVWHASSDASWCQVTTSGSGNGTLYAFYDENTGPVMRTANISVSVSELPVQQLQLIQLPSFVSVPEHAADVFQLFPNPTNGVFAIAGPGGKRLDMEVTITDIFGREVIRRECNGSATYQFDLSRESKGLYLVKATVGSQTILWKLNLK